METDAEIATRWRYLRDLLIQQLSQFEAGSLSLHASGIDVSEAAIAKLKNNIADFDRLIARNVARAAGKTDASA